MAAVARIAVNGFLFLTRRYFHGHGLAELFVNIFQLFFPFLDALLSVEPVNERFVSFAVAAFYKFVVGQYSLIVSTQSRDAVVNRGSALAMPLNRFV